MGSKVSTVRVKTTLHYRITWRTNKQTGRGYFLLEFASAADSILAELIGKSGSARSPGVRRYPTQALAEAAAEKALVWIAMAPPKSISFTYDYNGDSIKPGII